MSVGKSARSGLFALCASALLCALSVVIAWVCKTYFTFTVLGSGVRFTLENLPIILAGLWFGPVYGAAVGIGADLISTAMSQFGINPLVTLGAGMVGLTAGLVSWLIRRAGKNASSFGTVAAAVFAAHAAGSGLFKTLGLYLYHFYVELTWGKFTFSSLWLRVPTYLIIASIECYLAYVLVNNRAIAKQIGRIGK